MVPKPILVIVGPTSSGKSALAVKLAKEFNGEVVSADSRQVYRGLDLGAGKVTKKEAGGIHHHLLDVADPRRQWTVAQYQRRAEKAIKEILNRGKLPIVCGGSGFYVQAIIDGLVLPVIKPNPALRRRLTQKPADELFAILKNLDPRRAVEIDRQNPRRLIRAIEISQTLGKVPALKSKHRRGYGFFLLGLWPEPAILKQNIRRRLRARLQRGLVKEVTTLHRRGLSWRRMESLGLEYRFISRHLRGQLSRQEMVGRLNAATNDYAKRQLTWFKKDRRVHWLNNPAKARQLVKAWLASFPKAGTSDSPTSGSRAGKRTRR